MMEKDGSASTAPRRAVATSSVAGSPWWHRIALAGAVYSALAWALTLTYLTPNIGVQNSWPSRILPDGEVLPAVPAGWPEWTSEEARLWMHELQLSAVVGMALCLLCAAAYRGRPVLPVLAGSGTLLVLTMTAVRQGWTVPRLLPWLAAVGLLVAVVVWWVALRLAAGRRPRAPRRLVIIITVLAAFLVPGSFVQLWYVPDGVRAPPALLLVALGLPVIFTLVATMGVLAASRRPAWSLPAGLVGLTAVGGVGYLQGIDAVPVFLILAPLVLGLPVAVLTIITIRGLQTQLGHHVPSWRLDGGRTSRWIPTWALLLVVPLLVGGVVTGAGTMVLAEALARLVLFPMEYGRTYDGVAFIPGAVVVGSLLGYAGAVWVNRARARDPVPEQPVVV